MDVEVQKFVMVHIELRHLVENDNITLLIVWFAL